VRQFSFQTVGYGIAKAKRFTLITAYFIEYALNHFSILLPGKPRFRKISFYILNLINRLIKSFD